MIDVVWHSQDDGRGRYNCTAMLNDMFDAYDVRHFGGLRMPQLPDGAVVVVHGGREVGMIDKLNMDIEPLPWVLLICLGDEESSFPIERIEHPRKKFWIQEPMIPGKHEEIQPARYLLDGYSHDFQHYRLKDVPRDLDWVFAGQVTHERRRQCVTALQSIDWGGVIVESKGYCQGVSRTEYATLLQRARIVPCPSGPMAQDAARPWEALECGAIPILDEYSPVRKEFGFWDEVLGPFMPLPTIENWDRLPRMIEELKRANLDNIAYECQKWWADYKSEFYGWLKKDLKELRK
jgi:hypothetical protein